MLPSFFFFDVFTSFKETLGDTSFNLINTQNQLSLLTKKYEESPSQLLC